MEELYEEVVAKLSKHERAIINAYMDSKLQTAERAAEIALQASKNENLRQQMDFEVLKVKFENLNKELATANWEKITKSDLIDVRSFLDYFDRNKLNQEIFDRSERFGAYAKENEKDLKSWRLTIRSFEKAFQSLYRKVNASAHPLFTSKDILAIAKDNLEPRELQMLGFLWDKFPVPRGYLHAKYPNNELCNVLKKYRK